MPKNDETPGPLPVFYNCNHFEDKIFLNNRAIIQKCIDFYACT